MTKKLYIQQCPACGNYVEGREMRGFVRQMVHNGPETIVEWVPVGGKLIWKGTKEVARLLMKTNMEQWGEELEKMLYKDIQLNYRCPKCGKEWSEKHALSQSEYKQWIADIIESAKALVYRQKTSKKETVNDEYMTKGLENTNGTIRLQIPYSVVGNFVKERYKIDLKLGYVNEDTIVVSKDVKMIVSKNISVNASVLQVKDNDIMFSYQAGMFIDPIIKSALCWFKNTFSGQADILNDRKIQVHLAEIPQLETVLKQVALQGINFDEEHINVLFRLK